MDRVVECVDAAEKNDSHRVQSPEHSLTKSHPNHKQHTAAQATDHPDSPSDDEEKTYYDDLKKIRYKHVGGDNVGQRNTGFLEVT